MLCFYVSTFFLHQCMYISYFYLKLAVVMCVCCVRYGITWAIIYHHFSLLVTYGVLEGAFDDVCDSWLKVMMGWLNITMISSCSVRRVQFLYIGDIALSVISTSTHPIQTNSNLSVDHFTCPESVKNTSDTPVASNWINYNWFVIWIVDMQMRGVELCKLLSFVWALPFA